MNELAYIIRALTDIAELPSNEIREQLDAFIGDLEAEFQVHEAAVERDFHDFFDHVPV